MDEEKDRDTLDEQIDLLCRYLGVKRYGRGRREYAAYPCLRCAVRLAYMGTPPGDLYKETARQLGVRICTRTFAQLLEDVSDEKLGGKYFTNGRDSTPPCKICGMALWLHRRYGVEHPGGEPEIEWINVTTQLELLVDKMNDVLRLTKPGMVLSLDDGDNVTATYLGEPVGTFEAGRPPNYLSMYAEVACFCADVTDEAPRHCR